MIKFKCYFSARKLKNVYLAPDPCNLTSAEIKEVLDERSSEDFKFINRDGVDITSEMIMRVIKNLELARPKPGLTKLLFKVIREGGFSEFILRREVKR